MKRNLVPLCLALVVAVVAAGVIVGEDVPARAETGDLPTDPQRPDESTLEAGPDPGYRAEVEVVEGARQDPDRDTVTGTVFHDTERDGTYEPDTDSGVEGVTVSNGRDVDVTDSDGRYELPAREDMTVSVTKPANYAVPFDDDLIPQMSYNHKPEGSPQLRFGGLEPTGPVPEEVNFPMVPTGVSEDFQCAVLGDTQPYSNNEVGYLRDSVLDALLARDLSSAECMLVLGDVLGDDLGLFPRFTDMMSAAGLPQYYVPGNHDIDFDATDQDDSTDTWRREYGPDHYSFDIGEVHFVVLDNVVYPCGEQDVERGDREFCGEDEPPTYNGRIDDTQMEWLAADLATVDEDRLVVVNHHIPLVSFIDNASTQHQTDNAAELYDLLGDREVLSLSGHTHTIEQLEPGESYEGWSEAVGVDEVPFHHIVAGAASGAWFGGDLDIDGVPMSISRLGEPRGYYMMDFAGTDYTERFHATGQPADRQMWLSFNTPQFRDWFQRLRSWTGENPPTAEQVPPVNVGDLDDMKLVTPQDLDDGVYLTANVWNGSRDSSVTATVGGGEPFELERTQDGAGEDVRYGVDFADPFATVRQLQVARYAFESTSGNERAQGWEQFRGARRGPAPPQGLSPDLIAEKSSHLWRARLPSDLPLGTHVVEVTFADRYGAEFTDRITVEVREERPDRFWRDGPWGDGD
ncbi:calcineurin-like phosphoesterase C-terminal domain-containing protein [Haloechinothrix sp. YIM 98757]|uniref:Calcineurin-like phosphoesterase C-terminal domain-containing protein n=1 Tax=Haloechinothrix aidingensis TaxID=2752311 RepID=A0A838A8F9_9PSEU|nr:calcineurin-like phosphoesterase C-terminal domain-containing protein [Haloechinothrix aidingensis]